MTSKVLWVSNDRLKNQPDTMEELDYISEKSIAQATNFHRSFPQYAITPLHELNQLAKAFQVKNIWLKDESYRFGLNAFKVLGGSFAVANYLSKKLGMDIKHVNFELLASPEVKAKLGEITFITATDGNHGRGVAWAARQLGQKAVVYMPKGSAAARFDNIKAEGAAVSITELNYDDTVRLANKHAEENGWVLIQDAAWEGYKDIPAWIMQGYGTIMGEAIQQISELGEDKPTHVFLQAGVGCFAASMLGYLVTKYGENRPVAVVVEPDKAACFYKSVAAGDGNPHAVTGMMETIMAGLACGEPSTLSWDILKYYAQAFVSCPDYVTARGMRILANPLGNDPQVVSGESGAVGLGLLSMLAENKALNALKEKIGLDEHSKILIISTEGDTDAVGYQNIVWNGAYPYEAGNC
ncbi:diaminopropionate ammonia-lyase [Sporomusa sp. KB1]|uniref:diaminopropionate ammonia-lyase n=1 Tax=Sporomusa sp. KB1 TaxID=943346 RepID=UPI0011A5AEE1|nr:diaminopropionate ammonia-lyase [Sporomusa sp. KB1]TWH52047.1 diaminopropionate ammonia-lyase [Sporomusa sp. KB1]